MSKTVLFVLLILVSCQQKSEKVLMDPEKMLEKLQVTSDSLDQNPQSDKLVFWSGQLKQKEYSKTGPAIAFIHYNLAKSFAKTNIDSSKSHINIALDVIEKEKEFNALKFTIYNGAGLISEHEGKFYQSIYYFNKSTAIIMSDDSLQCKPLAKVICLLNAAQDNNKISQYPKSIEQNQLALKILNKLTEDNYQYKFRAYSQLLTACETSNTYKLDSLLFYIKKLKHISVKTNDPMLIRFTNEHMAHYYILENKYDTAISYYNLVKEYDYKIVLENPEKPSAIRNLYTTLSNLTDLYVDSKQFAEAENLIKETDKIERQHLPSLSYYEKCLNKQGKMHYYLAKGDNINAQNEANQVLELKDNILRNSGIQATEEMATIYELQAKDKSIYGLNKTIDHTTNRLERNKLLLFIVGLLALLAVSWIFLLYFFQRQKRQKQEKEKILLQQQLLRTQMEPHFIFNTLSALQSFIRFDEKEKSIKYLSQFSRLLRSSLELSRQNYVALDQELEAIENYLSLQQMRFQYTFAYKIIMPETDASAILIPPMLIQPFVENAIIHGIAKQSDKGLITLEIVPKENQVLVKITDNGKGYQDKSNIEDNHQSLSGAIARERLEILARENKIKTSIEITFNETGTVVLLVLPIKNSRY
ncbi:sensor histidine kinase [Flavobacterium branchiicola]|uniref:Sensor histidine kinase n=1 Tax=Flavobacterium branchiicola TaxID=1114875 RepID=A0ABV9PKH8_9FLAO|nr:histidine kinase [Flavobacterium branchiicola]MBS7256302.1 histidine kinase [Flavobacterium branchiicola]